MPFFLFFTASDTIWNNLEDIEDEEIIDLAPSLPNVLNAARAKSTTEKYRGWSKWLNWCSSRDEVRTVPANPFYVAIYLNFVLKTANNKGALATAFIRWGHHINGAFSLTDHPFVSLAFEGALRLCDKKSKTPKKPMTPEILKHLILIFNSGSLLEMRFLLICSLGFFGFFRIGELLSFTLGDIKIEPTHIEIFLETSKCDQHRGREGNIVPIYRLAESQFCPVNLLERFLSLANRW